MAKALECPDCGTRHPLKSLPGTRTFRCEQCHRLLKVPKELLSEVSDNGTPEKTAAQQAVGGGSPTTEASRPEPGPKRVPPSARGDAVTQQSRSARSVGVRPVVPRALRALVWLVAVPLGLVIVVAVARASGVFSVNAAMDVFIGVGFRRFVPPLVLLPVWAAVTATLAHFSIEGLGRLFGPR